MNSPIFKPELRVGDIDGNCKALTDVNYHAAGPARHANGGSSAGVGPVGLSYGAAAGKNKSATVGDEERDGLETLITVLDLPCDFDPVEEGDRTLYLRTKPRKWLIAEAQSFRHKASHYPHNPFCETCMRAHMRQQSFKRTGERRDDGLAALTAKNQQLSSDLIIAQRSVGKAPKRGGNKEGMAKAKGEGVGRIGKDRGDDCYTATARARATATATATAPSATAEAEAKEAKTRRARPRPSRL